MAGVTLALLLGSLLFYSWQSRMADRHLQQVQTLADSAILDLAEKLQQSSASTEQQASLFHSALTSLKRLRQNSGDDPRLLLAISKAYGRVGDLEGSPFVANLGNSSTAVTSYQEALRAATQAHARSPGEESTRVVIESYQQLGGIQAFLGNLREAHDSYQNSLSLALDFWKQKPDDPIRKRLLTLNYDGLGNVELSALEPDQALMNIGAAFQIFGSEPNGNEDHDRTLTRLYLRMGRVLNEIGPQSETLANVREAIAVAEELVQHFPSSKQVQRDLFATYQNIVLVLSGRDAMNVGDSRQAQVYARKALAIADSLAAGDNKNAQARYDLALAYTAMGDSFRSRRN
jgi:tetratricopeptide (TPR) repeat protein